MKYLKLMRIKHYIKNVLIFIPLIFSGMFFKNNKFLITLIGFICFSFGASIIYIINDIKDKEKDKKHQKKCNRPIASGKVSVKNALILILVLLTSITLIIMLSNMKINSIYLLILYFIINLGYSFGLKNVPFLFGAELLSIKVSNWLYLTVFATSFYLALGKRRNEILQNGSKTRNVLEYYSKDFLDKNMYMCLSMAIIFYSLWTTDVNIVKKSNDMLIWTVPIVIIICIRYSMQIENVNKNDGDPTEVITNDKYLIGLVLLLGLSLFCILYI